MGAPADWLVPDWPAPASVRALFTTRTGGISCPPFDSFNLGDHVRDVPAHVQANRERLRGVLDARPVFLQQVHGTAVVTLMPDTPDGTQADACLSTRTGQACTIMVADCLPVLITNDAGTVVAAVHAGWRGLAGEGGQGVLETTLTQVLRTHSEVGLCAQQLMAWLGPCIGPTAFEVGSEVRDAFLVSDPEVDQAFVPTNIPGKYQADLAALARLRLRALGLTRIYGNDSSPVWCTATQPSRFFSHRRDAARLGSTGRMAACIWRV